MITFIITVTILIALFIGFAIGRFGDKIGGHWNGPHHWIYGLIVFAIGIFYFEGLPMIFVSFFGVGFFISDLKDFLHLRFYGVDVPHKWKFWNID